jgi:hypothetical protein
MGLTMPRRSAHRSVAHYEERAPASRCF